MNFLGPWEYISRLLIDSAEISAMVCCFTTQSTECESFLFPVISSILVNVLPISPVREMTLAHIPRVVELEYDAS